MIQTWDLVPDAAIRPLSVLVIALFLVRFSPNLLRVMFRIIDRAFSSVDFIPSQVTDLVAGLVSPLRFMIAVVGIWVALLSLDLPAEDATMLNTIFFSLVVLIGFWIVMQMVAVAFELFQQRAKSTQDDSFNETLAEFGSRFSRAVLALIGISIVSQFWGYELSALVAGLGIGGLAVAFAAQEALSNLIGYFAIIADRPFEVGDYVVTDEFEGVVEVIGFRTTRIRRPDRAMIIVPNNALTNRHVTNWTLSNTGVRRGRFRIDLLLCMERDSPADALEVFTLDVRDMLNRHPRAVPESVVVNLEGFGEGWLNVRVVVVVNITGWSDLQDIRQDVNLYILRHLAAHELKLYEPK